MYRLAICDDELQICADLKSLIENEYTEKFEIECVGCVADYIDELLSGKKSVPDIAIMDIRLEGEIENGIAATIRLQETFPKTKVIFLTGYIEYATDIFMAKPSYFLVKPVDKNKLFGALDKTIAELQSDHDKQIKLQISGEVVILNASDVIYVESNKHELHIHCTEGVRKVWMRLDDFIKQTSDCFIRVHQSFAINPGYIRKFSQKEILMADGYAIPVSRKRYSEAKLQFVEYLERREKI